MEHPKFYVPYFFLEKSRFCVSHLIKRTKRKSNKRTRQAHASQLTHKIRRSIRTAVLVVSIGEPRGHWIIHELAISIELIVGVHLLLRIATTGIAVSFTSRPQDLSKSYKKLFQETETV